MTMMTSNTGSFINAQKYMGPKKGKKMAQAPMKKSAPSKSKAPAKKRKC